MTELMEYFSFLWELLKRDLKKKARAHNRRVMHQAMQGEAD